MLLRLLVIVSFVAAACSSAEPEPEALATDPVAAAEQWIEAVATGDIEALSLLVEPTGLAVVAAVENDLRSEELVALLDGGFSTELAASYWADFRDDFAVFSGVPWSQLGVAGEVAIPGSDTHAAVELAAGEAMSHVVVVETELGWQIDFAATTGPSLVGPLGEYLSSALSGNNASRVAAAYGEAVVPALQAAAALDDRNSALAFEAEYLRQLAATG